MEQCFLIRLGRIDFLNCGNFRKIKCFTSLLFVKKLTNERNTQNTKNLIHISILPKRKITYQRINQQRIKVHSVHGSTGTIPATGKVQQIRQSFVITS